MTKYINPIINGFYPDPSICRVDDDYYLVTSTFEYFPGVPIFHSKDLINWRQIGHVLDRPSQLDLDDIGASQGIYAPTIRHNNGVFYMITTNVGKRGNFIVTSTDPSGAWSEPYWLDGAEGIDPSLFFDDDGRAYYTGTRQLKDAKYFGNCEIWLRELDLLTMQLVGEEYSLWRGALKDAVWPEGPHIYKVNGYYYLIISEAGTGHQHAITMARSECITGHYVGNPSNPILTHRHLGLDYPIVNVGHSDIVQTQNGEWWMVLLGSRPFGGYYRNLGRETFLTPIKWENGWLIVNPSKGIIENEGIAPNLPKHKWPVLPSCDNFESDKLDYRWMFLRTPREEFFTLTERKGYLRLKLRPFKISQAVNSSFVGRRLQHKSFSVKTAMEFVPGNNTESAGIVLLQNNLFHFRFEYAIEKEKNVIRLVKCEKGKESILISKEFYSQRIYLKVDADEQELSFFYGNKADENIMLINKVDARILSTDIAGGFVGACVGMYATGGDNVADFDWFEYLGE